jgi:hypothetical protein
MTQQNNPPRDDLAHYGVKGMRWGVKKARTGDLNSHAKVLERVATGTGGKRDKLYAATRTPIKGLVKKGLKGGAAAEAAKSRAEIKRLATGKATAGDLLRAYGSMTLISLGRATRTKSDFNLNGG